MPFTSCDCHMREASELDTCSSAVPRRWAAASNQSLLISFETNEGQRTPAVQLQKLSLTDPDDFRDGLLFG